VARVKFLEVKLPSVTLGLFEIAGFFKRFRSNRTFVSYWPKPLRKTTVTCFGAVEAESSTMRGSKLAFIEVVII